MSGDPGQAGFTDLPGRARWIALAVFAAVMAAGVLPLTPGGPVAAAAALVAVGAAALLVRGWRPQLLFAAVATAGTVVLADGRSNNIGLFAVCLLAGWCVLTGSRREGLAYWAGAMIGFAVEWLWVHPDPGWGAWLAGVTLTVAFSLLVRHDRDLLGQLRRAQAGLAEQAKTQERNRIARELHDVIGHTLTVSLLHVQSARLAVQHDPADAARALAEAERLGQECLTEVRTTVGMLRRDAAGRDGPPGTAAPLPGAGGVPALVDQFRAAGADVSLIVEGDTGRLPATTGLAVYRILQEALTNAVKHAPRSPTTVRLAVGTGTVTLTTETLTAETLTAETLSAETLSAETLSAETATAGSRAGPVSGTGLGLVSMRERAESLGGTCQAGPGGHGWLVRATLPLDAGLQATL